MPPSAPDARRSAHAGFALPLALLALVVLALFAALLVDAALQEMRVSRGDVAQARAQAAAETALADALAEPADSALLTLPRGAARESVVTLRGDTTRIATQALGGGLTRVVATARTRTFGMRADAARIALLRVRADSTAGPTGFRFERLPGWWWIPVP